VVFGGTWQLDGKDVSSPLDAIACQVRTLALQLPASAKLELVLPEKDTLLAYVFEGRLDGSPNVQRGQMARFTAGESVTLTASEDGVRLLLLAGKPVAEPIAQYGPFVMNSEEEILQALSDYRNGRF
jgi:hypothetical protein